MEKNKASEVVHILTDALPYIQKFSGKIFVVKYGGAAMSETNLKYGFARDIALMRQVGMKVIVIHGGGPQIDFELNKKGIERKFDNGLRITDKETINIVSDVLCNQVNKEIVDLIASNGANAIGMTDQIKKILKVKKLDNKEVDLGFVGEVEDIDKNCLLELLENNYVPVIAPLGFDKDNTLYNINADSAASKIASLLPSEKFIILTNQQGVLDRNLELISELSPSKIRELKEDKIIKGGMLPKINACVDAINNGVKRCHIIDGRIEHAVLLELFTKEGIGTLIQNEI
tara:strand:+ start:1546 stop:2409 length:864 start_codon:yes stop_codon:yes gene_type:complete